MFKIFVDIRPGERRVTYGAFVTLFGVMAGHALLETARDALFLARLPASHLPWMYLGIAFVALGLFALQERQQDGNVGRRSLSVLLWAAALVTLAFWWFVAGGATWALYAIYIWTGVFATLIGVRFWTLIGGIYTARQAKRLFAFVGAGAVMGAIVGSLLARGMTEMFTAREMLLAATVIFAGSAAFPLIFFPKRDPSEPGRSRPGPMTRQDLTRPFRTLWDRPYLRRVGGIVLLSTITLTLVDYVFKASVAEHVPQENLGSFFATAYLLLNTLSLLTQLFLVSWLVRTLGVNRVLSVLPALLFFGAIGLVLGGGLIAAYVVKVIDGSLRHSLHRTATEVLYVPLTGEIRARVKGFIDVMGQRGGQALASVGILGVVAAGGGNFVLGIAVILLCAGWIYLAKTLKDQYLALFRQTVNEEAMRPRVDFPELDLASLESLMAALNSSNDREVLAAIDLLAEQDRTHLIPALILYHPSAEVVIRSLDHFARFGRDDFVPILDRLLEHQDPEVRAATLRARSWVAPSLEQFETFSNDESPVVRTTALVGRVSFGGSKEALETIETLARSGDRETKLALARAIRNGPGAAFEEVLNLLAGSTDIEVRLEVTRAMREIRSVNFVPQLLGMLPRRELRLEARKSLVAIGTDALQLLSIALSNRWLDPQVRRHIPRTISVFRTQTAADILMKQLPDEPDGAVRYKILLALTRLRQENPEIGLEETVLREVSESTLRNAFQLLSWRLSVLRGASNDPRRVTPVHDLILALLEHKEILAIERLFRLLDLLYSGEDLRTLYRGLKSGSRKSRDSSRELLENLIEPPMRDPLLALVEDMEPARKLTQAGPFLKDRVLGYEEVLRQLLDRGGIAMKSLVSYHVGELGFRDFKEQLESLPSDPAGFIARSVEKALAKLDSKETEGVT